MRLLDLFCGAGGCAVGYNRAGFDGIVGVDIAPQPHYPFEFVQADALEYLAEHGHEFDVIHASPPCQRWCTGTHDRAKHPALIAPTRKLLLAIGKPYIIENVRHAPLRADVRICGCQVGLPHIRRVRHFETEPRIFALMPACDHRAKAICVVGHGNPSGTLETWGRYVTIKEMRAAMGIDWMNRDELSQAIPPAYTEWLGRRMLKAIMQKATE